MKPINPSSNMVTRKEFLRILDAGLSSASYRFTRQAALTWLALFQGDMAVSLVLAKTMIGEGKYISAIKILEKLTASDPEFLEAWQALTGTYHLAGMDFTTAKSCVEVLSGRSGRGDHLAEWCADLCHVKKLVNQGDFASAERLIHQVVNAQPDLRLAAVMHLVIDRQLHDETTIFQLVSLYHDRWGDCLAFSLCLGELMMARGDENGAVSLLHQCVADDLTGQVAGRLWGKDHRYQPLWPEGMQITLDMGIPAEVAGPLGLNRLPEGERIALAQGQPVRYQPEASTPAAVEPAPVEQPSRKAVKEKDASLDKVNKSMEKLAKKVKKPDIARADGRFPMYVVFSSRLGLDNKYGPKSREVIFDQMKQLVANVAQRPGWGGLAYLPDDETCTAEFGLKALDSYDPWKLKLALADLDQALGKKGQMIGALLIVGGADVVPFHNLPNPTDDDDREVPSDNPYSTLDANFFVPEWPIGRLPGEDGSEAGSLLESLRACIRYHGKSSKTLPDISGLVRVLMTFLRSRMTAAGGKNFGYTAEVWQKSSAVVFKESGNGQLYNSPPDYFGSVPSEKVMAAPLAYFNLHGMAENPEWYGQRDFNNIKPGPDYPVALTPGNLVKNGHAPQVVFTEACYGGHILQKSEEKALALKFLGVGALGVVGSTVISYGSVAAPLIGADLLGFHFWRNLQDGMTTGEALMQAKLSMVKEMNKRQGFLDGEDQKTLISFVLYGDPLVTVGQAKTKVKHAMRSRETPQVTTICDRRDEALNGVQVSSEMLRAVKRAVEPYLPGLEQAEMVISRQHAGCDSKSHVCPTSRMTAKVNHPIKADGIVMTFSKKVTVDQLVHKHFARVTVNQRGKVTKLALSR